MKFNYRKFFIQFLLIFISVFGAQIFLYYFDPQNSKRLFELEASSYAFIFLAILVGSFILYYFDEKPQKTTQK